MSNGRDSKLSAHGQPACFIEHFICVLLLLLLSATPVAASASGTLALPASGSEMGPISAGAFQTCVLAASGGVICWGYYAYTEYSLVPEPKSGLSSGVAAIAAGSSHTCVLTTGGGVKCFGQNDSGQLGNNSTVPSAAPVDVNGLASGVIAIAAGGDHTCAVTTTGGVKCWGDNLYGALGNGSTLDSPIPVDVSGLSSGVTAIAAGLSHNCALKTTGAVMCWGFNTAGQLGVEPITNIPTPVEVTGISSGATAIAAGAGHSCALMTTGGAVCWGSNSNGQLGNYTTGWYSYIPVNVNGLSSGVSAITTSYGHTCALTETGGVKCWGYNWNGELGNNSDVDSHVPVDVIGLSSGVSAIAAGHWHVCALKTVGGIMCWGDNSGGQLGNNSYVGSHVPVDVYSVTPPSGSSYVSVGSYDGWIVESAETTSTGGSINAGGTTFNLGDDASNRQFRGILSFDTSGLPPEAVITSVKLQIKSAKVVGKNPFNSLGAIVGDIKQGSFSNKSKLQIGDFQAAASKKAALTFNSTSTDGWYSDELDPVDFHFINRTGVTQFRLRFAKDDNNNHVANYIKFYSGNYLTDPSYRPMLVIEYHLP